MFPAYPWKALALAAASSVLLFLAFAAPGYAPGGSRKLVEMDVSGMNSVSMAFSLKRQSGIDRNHVVLFLKRRDGSDFDVKPYSVVVELTNKDGSDHEVYGGAVGEVMKLPPGGKYEIRNVPADSVSFVVSDLKRAPSAFEMKVGFDPALPAGTKLVLMGLWADGP